MFVTGMEWWDFVSYNNKYPILIKRVFRDEEYIKKLARELYIFCEQVSKWCEQYNKEE